MIEDSFGYIVSGVFTIVLRVILGIAIAIAILFFITYGVIRLTVLQPFQIKSFVRLYFNEYIISAYTFVRIYFTIFKTLYFKWVLGVFSIILLFTSCIYLIAKYSVNRKLRIPSFTVLSYFRYYWICITFIWIIVN